MQDIDFDELDRAVQGMMAGDAATPASVEDNPFISDAPATPAPTPTPQPTTPPTPTPAPTQAPTKPPVVTTPAPTQPPVATVAPVTPAPSPTPAAVVTTPPPAAKKPEVPRQTPAIWPPVTPAPLPTWAPVVTAAPRSRPTPQPSQTPVTTPAPAAPASQAQAALPAAPAKTSAPLAAPAHVAAVTPAPIPTPTLAPSPEIHTRTGGGLQHQLTSTRRQGGVESKRVLPVHKVIKLESPMPPQSPELPVDATAATAVPATSLTALVTPTPTPQPTTPPTPTPQPTLTPAVAQKSQQTPVPKPATPAPTQTPTPTPTPAVSSVFGNYDTLAPHGKLTIRTAEAPAEPVSQPTATPQPATSSPTAIAVTTLPATKAPEPTTPPSKPASKAQATAIAVTSKVHAVPVTPAAATKAAPPAKRARKRVSIVAAGTASVATAAAVATASHAASSAAQASSIPVATQAVRRQRSGGRFMDMVQAAPTPAKTLGPSARAQARRRRAVPAEIVPTPPMPPSLESPAPAAADDHVMAEIETAVVQATHRPEHGDLFASTEGDTSFVHHATNDELAGTTNDYTDHTYTAADDDAAYDNIVNSYHATPAPQTDEPDNHEPYSTAADEYDDQASGSHEPDDMFAQVDPIEPAEETGVATHSEQHYYGLTDDERAALEQRRSAVFQEGPQAIDQQYQESVAPEADGHAVSDIYDTQRYHTPLGDTPHKKRRDPWAWVTAGLLLIMLGSICFILWYAGIMAF